MKKTQAQIDAEKQLKANMDAEIDAYWRQAASEREIELAQLQLEWSKLLEQEEKAFTRSCDLDNTTSDKSDKKSEAVREWWSIANAVLWMFTRTRAQLDHELQPFPAVVFGRLANIAEEISNGIIPTFVDDARKGGRPMYRAERHHIAYAVFYIEAAKRGEIEDNSPNKTVRQAYNVTAKAVQGWVRKRDSICVGVPFKNLSPEKLRKKMLECGEIYARLGRGAPAHN